MTDEIPSTQAIKVVCVDDEQNLRILMEAFIERHLQGNELEIRTGRDGEELSDLVRENNPRVIVTDNSMPSKTGLEAISELRSSGYNTPIILATGDDPVSIREKLNGTQHVYLLPKPFNIEQFGEALRTAYPNLFQPAINI